MFLQHQNIPDNFPSHRTEHFIVAVDKELQSGNIPDNIIPDVLWVLEGLFKQYMPLDFIAAIEQVDVHDCLIKIYSDLIKEEEKKSGASVPQNEKLKEDLTIYQQKVEVRDSVISELNVDIGTSFQPYPEEMKDILLSFTTQDTKIITYPYYLPEHIYDRKESQIRIAARMLCAKCPERFILQSIPISWEQLELAKKHFYASECEEYQKLKKDKEKA
ncbi:hypothetical protein CN918_28765 [Priestia megaterium]|nr:hypothetical protein CN918_28765 [Priestia megaterium]